MTKDNELKTDRNEPAFPQTQGVSIGDVTQFSSQHGMTLRDYFAAKAMQGDFACDNTCDAYGLAEWAYKVADAMMEARKK